MALSAWLFDQRHPVWNNQLTRTAAETEPSAETAQQIGQSRRTYFAVITLVALVMIALPNIFIWEFEVHVIIPYASQSGSSTDILTLTSYLAFLISPCLFFVILYLYGKRMARHFSDSYLKVIPLLFLGSALGVGVYFVFLLFNSGGPAILNGTFWIAFSYSLVSESVRGVFVGFTALGLSYLRDRNSEQNLSV